jgi:glucosamine 6-phosphate synthetase-like amidotransferase/phosphosugar isomerase protein
VGVVGKYNLERLLRIPVEPMLASEFRYCDPLVTKNTLVIVISQSGETLDTMAALREAKSLRRAHSVHRERGGQLHRPGVGRRAIHLGRARK